MPPAPPASKSLAAWPAPAATQVSTGRIAGLARRGSGQQAAGRAVAAWNCAGWLDGWPAAAVLCCADGCLACPPVKPYKRERVCHTCQDVSGAGCTQCYTDGTCKACRSGFYLDAGKRCQVCAAADCNECNPDGSCKTCRAGFYAAAGTGTVSKLEGSSPACLPASLLLSANRQTCRLPSPPHQHAPHCPHLLQCTRCTATRCDVCNPNGTCKACKSPYVYNAAAAEVSSGAAHAQPNRLPGGLLVYRFTASQLCARPCISSQPATPPSHITVLWLRCLGAPLCCSARPAARAVGTPARPATLPQASAPAARLAQP
jgi:hypothetical protein